MKIKNLLTAACIGAIFALGAVALVVTTNEAEAFFGSQAWDGVSSAKYRVDASGWDIRVYEFVPQGDPSSMCAIAMAQKGPIGMQCWKGGDVKPTADESF